MKTIVKVLLIWCIVFLDKPDAYTSIWWFLMFTFALSIIDDVRCVVKLTKDNE